jgi:hypothetical protein
LILLALIGLKFVRMASGSADKDKAAVDPVSANAAKPGP